MARQTENTQPSSAELQARRVEVRARISEIDTRLTAIETARVAALQALKASGDLLAPLPDLSEPPDWARDEKHLLQLKDALTNKDNALATAIVQTRREEQVAQGIALRARARALTVKLQEFVGKMRPVLDELGELHRQIRQAGVQVGDGPPVDLFRLLQDERRVRLWLESERMAEREQQRAEQARIDVEWPRQARQRLAAREAAYNVARGRRPQTRNDGSIFAEGD